LSSSACNTPAASKELKKEYPLSSRKRSPTSNAAQQKKILAVRGLQHALAADPPLQDFGGQAARRTRKVGGQKRLVTRRPR